jgi:hypothetical protein
MARVALAVTHRILAATLTLVSPGVAWADEAAGREAAMFGDPEPAPGAGTEPDREAEMFGGDEGAAPAWTESDTESRLLERLQETDDTLAIGGQLYLRYVGSRSTLDGSVTVAEGIDPLPGSREEDDVSAPALLDIYLDARPSDRVRAYSRIRMTHLAVADRTDWLLDQLWLKFDVGRTVFLTVGRQHIKWGVGRIWNPTDFLMEPRNPLAVFDERTGRNFLKLHLPWESMGWNLYAVGEVVSEEGKELPGGAARAELVVGSAEVAVTAYKREDLPVRIGVDLSAGLGPIDLRGEAAWYSDHEKARIVGGVEVPFNYSDEDSVTVGVEYLENPLPDLSSPFYRGERGVGGYVVLMSPGSWNDTTVIANVIHNLDQKDLIGRLDWQVRVLTYLRVNVYAQRSQFFDFAFTSDEVKRLKLDLPPSFEDLVFEKLEFDQASNEVGVGFTLSL